MAERRPLLRLKSAVRRRALNLLADALRAQGPTYLTDEVAGRLDALAAQAALAQVRLDSLRRITEAVLDDVPRLRRRLEEVRSQPDYESNWSVQEPLITVRIATYNLAEVLVERALASVLRQTYPRFEVIVVGDACTDDTEARIRKLGDPRIRFVNLPLRGDYPEGPHRQMVAGAPCMNLAARLARGTWLAPLDDDDEFTPDHLEVLLATALQGHYELAYGNFRMVRPEGGEPEVYGRWPPTYGEFGYQAAIYLTALRFFEYDTRSWLLEEPADMTLRRRMVDAGVRMGWVDKVVATYYPGLLHRPSRE